MTAWKFLYEFLESHVLPEEKMYRGETNVRLKDIEALFDAIRDQGSGGDPKLGSQPNPQGDVIDVTYEVDPRVWGRWSRSPNFAAIMGSTKDDPHPGRSQGGTMMKGSKGRVFFQPGPRSTSHERMPSAMDRYDVMMVGDVEGAPVPDRGATAFPSAGKPTARIVVNRIAWSPAIGSTEERQGRLRSLIGGGVAAPLRRRAQGHVPDVRQSDLPPAQPVPRQGQNLRPGKVGSGD